jgi:NADH-quinone oxidoreductase subunit N
MNPIDTGTPLGVSLALLPEIVVSVAAMGVLLVTAWRHRSAADSRLAGWLSLAGLVAGLGTQIWLWTGGARGEGISQMVAVDGYRFAANVIFLLAAAVTVVLSLGYLEREGMLAPEYYTLLLLATVGTMLLGGATDLILVFLGLEVMSVAVYVLAGYDRRNPFSSEAALKYFLIGAFASGFLLYGIALVYGAAGTTNLQMIGAQYATGGATLMGTLGLALLLIGFLFKVAAVPFHMWAPDVYDGAPTPVTGFMATAVKAAGFVALTRMVLVAFPAAQGLWQPVLGILAIATMVVGNLIALSQRSLKRMLAYSSVAHAGYLLAAVWPGTRIGAASVLVYLLAYGLTSLAAFGLLAALGREGERDVTTDDLAGLARDRPWMAIAMAVCMLSLLGFPGTFGFIGKWMILSALITSGQWLIPVVLVLASVVSAGYYLPVIMAMYMKPARNAGAHDGAVLTRPAVGVLAVIIVAIVVLGVVPTEALAVSMQTATALFDRAFAPLGP